MYIVLSLLNIIRRIVNLLIEITPVDLYPSKCSASVLSDARDVLRRREIILTPVSRTPGTNRPPNSGMQGTVLALPDEIASVPAHCIPASRIYPSVLLSAGGTHHLAVVFAAWPAPLLPPSTCSGAILHPSGVFPCWGPRKLLSVCCKDPLRLVLMWRGLVFAFRRSTTSEEDVSQGRVWP